MTKDEQRIVKLVREIDAERKLRIEAQRKASALRALVARMQIERQQMKAALATSP
jgi:hypothetical protein